MKKRIGIKLLTAIMCINLLAGCGTAAIAGAGVLVIPSTTPTARPTTVWTPEEDETEGFIKQRLEMIDRQLTEVNEEQAKRRERWNALKGMKKQLEEELQILEEGSFMDDLLRWRKKRRIEQELEKIQKEQDKLLYEYNYFIYTVTWLISEKEGLDGTRANESLNNSDVAELDRKIEEKLREQAVAKSLERYIRNCQGELLSEGKYLGKGYFFMNWMIWEYQKDQVSEELERILNELVELCCERRNLIKMVWTFTPSPTPGVISTLGQEEQSTSEQPVQPAPVVSAPSASVPSVEVIPTASAAPVPVPTKVPTTVPTTMPTTASTTVPTVAPTGSPTSAPSAQPTASPAA